MLSCGYLEVSNYSCKNNLIMTHERTSLESNSDAIPVKLNWTNLQSSAVTVATIILGLGVFAINWQAQHTKVKRQIFEGVHTNCRFFIEWLKAKISQHIKLLKPHRGRRCQDSEAQ